MNQTPLKIFVLSLLLFAFQPEKESVSRMNIPSFSTEIVKLIPHIIDFNDTIPNDTLLEHINADNFPVMYSRRITTGVCIKGECRPVHIEVYWNITGRYLGFMLPAGEFLSKTKHIKFHSAEYDRLHFLLSDRNSPLATYSLEELVVIKDTAQSRVDAVTSATITAVLEYIVEGAVYTTYTLWHTVYGQTKREIEKLTTEKLNDKIVLELLESEKLEDRIWTLNHISGKIELSPELQKKLVQIISGYDVYLAERALNAIQPNALNGELQKQLINIIDNAAFLQKRFIIQKLREAPSLNEEVAVYLSSRLKNLNTTLVKLSLELFDLNDLDAEPINLKVSELLKNENRYISEQAYSYLKTKQHLDKRTLKSVEKYRKKS